MAKHYIDVPTGIVKVGRERSILTSNGIGSCVVVALYDPKKKIGGLAHVMLPGKASINNIEKRKKTRYAVNALDELKRRMTLIGADDIRSIQGVLIGGANVLKSTDDIICSENIRSCSVYLEKNGIAIKARAVGGTARRTVTFNIGFGKLYSTEGNGKNILLHSFARDPEPFREERGSE
ncbi:MAG: chemotaxis protein CheD [Candidatus Omnitrophica bacterium]|nr:chemotaxis protein CheD [Candidatus Omnitrophota bacterium]MDD5487746.1 chemotaxis protein CheD [Candidatus Omnitrophota bacterium]